MNNNGMIEYKEGIISKIKNFFKKLFENQEKQQINEIKGKKEEKQETFINEIKVDGKVVDSVIERKNFLKEIDGNEEALNMLSIDRLKKLEEYYNNIIEQNNVKIKKLKGIA